MLGEIANEFLLLFQAVFNWKTPRRNAPQVIERLPVFGLGYWPIGAVEGTEIASLGGLSAMRQVSVANHSQHFAALCRRTCSYHSHSLPT